MNTLMLDCGGVIIAPTTGDWVLPPGHEAILGEAFADTRLDAFRSARGPYLPMLPDANRVDTLEEECAMFVPYYARVFEAMDMHLPQKDLERLAALQVYGGDRYLLFGDVMGYLARWSRQYRLGIISDAPPSTRHIMEEWGIPVHAAVYSCEIGVLKPNAAIFAHALAKIGAEPGDAVFVDDMPHNLLGAQAAGMQAIQMLRPMPARFAPQPIWDGPVAHSFAELDALLSAMA